MPRSDPSVQAELRGSLTILEDGTLVATRDLFGAVVDKFGVYRPCEDDRLDDCDRRRDGW